MLFSDFRDTLWYAFQHVGSRGKCILRLPIEPATAGIPVNLGGILSSFYYSELISSTSITVLSPLALCVSHIIGLKPYSISNTRLEYGVLVADARLTLGYAASHIVVQREYRTTLDSFKGQRGDCGLGYSTAMKWLRQKTRSFQCNL
jgi:hypothetical protein